MVSTLDGRITIGGRSGPIGGEADRLIFHGLRTQADAVMAGAGTIRVERYGRLVRAPERRDVRERHGLAADPIAVIPSARLALPPDLPLLQDPSSRVVVLTASDDELGEVPATVEYLRAPLHRTEAGRAMLELRPLLERLRADFGVRSIVCEGGPALNDALFREGLVDEIFLSLAPKIAAGVGPTMATGAELDPPRELDLVSCLEAQGTLFLRYRITG